MQWPDSFTCQATTNTSIIEKLLYMLILQLKKNPHSRQTGKTGQLLLSSFTCQATINISILEKRLDMLIPQLKKNPHSGQTRKTGQLLLSIV